MAGFLGAKDFGFLPASTGGGGGGGNTTSGKVCMISSGTSTIDTTDRYGYNAVFYQFTITDCTNYYSGNLVAVWNADTGSIEFTETSTSSIGNTAGVSFAFTMPQENVNLRVTVPSNQWKFSYTKTVIEDCCNSPLVSEVITTEDDIPIATESLPSQEIISNLGDFLVDNSGNIIVTAEITSEILIT